MVSVLVQLFIGSFITLVVLFFAIRIFAKDINYPSKNPYRYSQSNIHHIVSPFLPDTKKLKPVKETQSKKHYDKTNVKVIIIEGEAFWIKDNVFYTAKIVDGGVDSESTSVVDTMSMDRVQLDKMLFIMDQLRDGKINDSGDSGNK